MPNSVTYLNRTPILSGTWLGVELQEKIAKEIGLHALNLITIADSTIYIIIIRFFFLGGGRGNWTYITM